MIFTKPFKISRQHVREYCCARDGRTATAGDPPCRPGYFGIKPGQTTVMTGHFTHDDLYCACEAVKLFCETKVYNEFVICRNTFHFGNLCGNPYFISTLTLL